MESVEQGVTGTELTRRGGVYLAITAIAVSFVGFNLLLGPNGSSPSSLWLIYCAFGIHFSMPLLLAIWAALGLGSVLYRLPLSAAVLILAILADGYTSLRLYETTDRNYYLNLSIVAGIVGVFVVFFIVFALLRRWTGLRIAPTSEFGTNTDERKHQFDLKYLLCLMTICALLMAIGRNFRGDWASPLGNRPNFFSIVIFVTLLSLLVLPSAIQVFIVIATSRRLMLFLTLVLAWIASLCLAVATLVLYEGAPPGKLLDAASFLFLVQFGATISALASATVLRQVRLRAVRIPAPDAIPRK
jgi:hypothetical protein